MIEKVKDIEVINNSNIHLRDSKKKNKRKNNLLWNFPMIMYIYFREEFLIITLAVLDLFEKALYSSFFSNIGIKLEKKWYYTCEKILTHFYLLLISILSNNRRYSSVRKTRESIFRIFFIQNDDS